MLITERQNRERTIPRRRKKDKVMKALRKQNHEENEEEDEEEEDDDDEEDEIEQNDDEKSAMATANAETTEALTVQFTFIAIASTLHKHHSILHYPHALHLHLNQKINQIFSVNVYFVCSAKRRSPIP